MNEISHPQSKSGNLAEQILLSLLLGFLVFFGSLIISIIGYQIWHLGRIYPGVSVASIIVDGLSPTNAAQKITQDLTFPHEGQFMLHDQQQSWMVSPAELGLFLDPKTSARDAYSIGRSGNPINRLYEQFEALYYGRDNPPTMIFDQRLAILFLSNLSSNIDHPVVEPSLSVQGTDVVIIPGQVGRQLDITATLDLISTQMQSLQNGAIPLVVKETNPIIVDVTEQAELARNILSQPLTITMPDEQPDQLGPWVFDPPTLASMLAFEHIQDEDKADYQVVISYEMLLAFLTDIEPSLQLLPQNTRFIFNDDTRELDLIEPAVIGRTFDIEASIHAIQDKIIKGEHTISLEFTFTPPPVTNDATSDELGIRELIHAETSYFYGSSPARVQNISASASRFHGLFVAPGETFSMSQALGDISLDNGYAEALIIYGDQTIKGIGGGVCQVSTTLFRTAFFSGFPISERHPHSYRVNYYEKTAGNQIDPNLAGLDATVFVPLVDLKFTNDTPYWMLMETYVNPSYSSIVWKFYSTSDGRSVEWKTTGPVNIVEAPDTLYTENPDLPTGEVRQVDWEADGADVTVTRLVYLNGEVHLEDIFFTRYQPWMAVIEYGPDTEGYPPEQPEDGDNDD